MAYGRYYMVVVIGLGLALVLIGGLYAFHKISQYENNSVKSQTSQIPAVPDGTSAPAR
jgi:hypothetical protein